MSRNKVEEHQLYVARPHVWAALRRANTIDPQFKPLARRITRYTRLASFLGWLQRRLYNRKIHRIPIEKQPPIFILGHWRSGTTHLHYMMAKDPRLGFISNYQNFFFNIAFLTRSWFKPIVARFFPKTRMVDNMDFSPSLPAEEEQAFASFSAKSAIHSFFFPRNRTYFEKFLFFRGISKREMKRWKREYRYLIKAITHYMDGKPLVLKNPLNTARVKVLVEMFPDAKFVYIHRDPYEVFRSTIHLYNTITRSQMFQEFSEAELEDLVIYLFRNVLQNYLDQRDLIPEGNLLEVSYEELSDKPYELITRIYEELNIPGFEKAKPEIEAYLDSVKGYKRNKFTELPLNIVKRLNEEWDFFFKAFDYEKRPVNAAPITD